MCVIRVDDLSKKYGEKIVLHDVTASVEREDRIGIVGQNGAGKTTLLKILTGEWVKLFQAADLVGRHDLGDQWL